MNTQQILDSIKAYVLELIGYEYRDRAEAAAMRAEAAKAAAESSGKPAGGWLKSSLATAVQASLNKADTALQTAPTVTSATASVQGILRLTGDLAGTAATPRVAANAIDPDKLALSVRNSLARADSAIQTVPAVTVDNLSGAGTVGTASMKATTQVAGRNAIGAGTGNSNLELGTTGSTAMTGNRIQQVNSLPSNPVAGVLYLIPE